MSTNSLPLSSLTSNSPSITPPRSEDEEEIVEVVITPQLQNEQPKLAGMILNAISARNMVNIGAIFTVPESGIETYSNSRFKGVFWHGYEGRAGVLWLDAQEFRTLVSLNAADRVIASFREAHGLTVYSDVYLIIHNGDTLSDADRELIRSGQEALTEQLKIIAVSVNGLDAAADSILDLSLKFICKVCVLRPIFRSDLVLITSFK
ncbi:hypothetical protein V5O48_008817 [Marasmius crinis-equi]|uniref:Uncharacterized protein n=1 Tax=Marasmius crinis-equi TaxID=585013 RepID=A0ABR3FD75_9AGAR